MNKDYLSKLKKFSEDCSSKRLEFFFDEETGYLYSGAKPQKIAEGFILKTNLVKRYLSSSGTQYLLEFYVLIPSKNPENCTYNAIGYPKDTRIPLSITINHNKTKGTYSFIKKDLLDVFEFFDIKIYNPNIFIRTANLYLNWQISKLKTKKLSGWKKDKYIGVTSYVIYSPIISNNLFNGIFKEYYRWQENFDVSSSIDSLAFFHVSLTNNLSLNPYTDKAMQVVRANPKLLIAFIYSLIAIGKYLFKSKKRNKELAQYYKAPSALCICGTSKYITAYAAANIISNMLNIDADQINNILRSSNNVNTSRADFDYKKFTNYNDITLLVYSKNCDLTSRSRYVKKILTDFVDRNINYCPVFVSKKPFNLQECFDLDISDFTPVYKDISLCSYTEIAEMKEFINSLYIGFIRHISGILAHAKTDMLMSTYNENNYLTPEDLYDIHTKCESYVQEKNKLYPSSDNIVAFYQQLLMFTYLFDDFLRKNELSEIGSQLIEIMKSLYPYFFDVTLSGDADSANPEHCFKAYIRSIFVTKEYTPKYAYFEGIEKGPGKEACCYLEGSKYFDDFVKQYKLSITPIQFNRLLRELGLIKTRPNNKSVVMSRVFNNERKNYLVVLKDKI